MGLFCINLDVLESWNLCTQQSLVFLAVSASLQHCRFTSYLEFQFWYTWNKERRCGVEKKTQYDIL